MDQRGGGDGKSLGSTKPSKISPHAWLYFQRVRNAETFFFLQKFVIHFWYMTMTCSELPWFY